MKKSYLYITLVVLCAVMVLAFSQGTFLDPKVQFMLTANHQLAPGDRVEMQGVVVGEIVKVDFDETGVYDRQYRIAVARIKREYFHLLHIELKYLVKDAIVSTGVGRIDIVDSGIAARTRVMPGDKIFVHTPVEQFYNDTEEVFQDFLGQARPIGRQLFNKIQEGLWRLKNRIEASRADSSQAGPGSEQVQKNSVISG